MISRLALGFVTDTLRSHTENAQRQILARRSFHRINHSFQRARAYSPWLNEMEWQENREITLIAS